MHKDRGVKKNDACVESLQQPADAHAGWTAGGWSWSCCLRSCSRCRSPTLLPLPLGLQSRVLPASRRSFDDQHGHIRQSFELPACRYITAAYVTLQWRHATGLRILAIITVNPAGVQGEGELVMLFKPRRCSSGEQCCPHYSALASHAVFCNRVVCGSRRVNRAMRVAAAAESQQLAGMFTPRRLSCKSVSSSAGCASAAQLSPAQAYSFFRSRCCHATRFPDLHAEERANK